MLVKNSPSDGTPESIPWAPRKRLRTDEEELAEAKRALRAVKPGDAWLFGTGGRGRGQKKPGKVFHPKRWVLTAKNGEKRDLKLEKEVIRPTNLGKIRERWI